MSPIPVTCTVIDSWSLVHAAQRGDMAAYGELWRRYVPAVYRFVYTRTTDRTLAEDITSETFLRALSKLRTVIDRGDDVAAWFITIARNIILDHVKSSRHRLEALTSEFFDTGTDLDPADIVIRVETSAVVRELMDCLNTAEKTCITQRFLNDQTVPETAVFLSRTVPAVKTLQTRALRKLHARATHRNEHRMHRMCAQTTCTVIISGCGLYCSSTCQRAAVTALDDSRPGERCVIPSCNRPLPATKRERRALTCSTRCRNHLTKLRAILRQEVTV